MTNLPIGDPAPWFIAPASNNPRFVFASAGGRHIVLTFYGSAADPEGGEAIRRIEAAAALFDDTHCAFFGVTADPADRDQGRVTPNRNGYRFFWDTEGEVARLYDVLDENGRMRLTTLILDPNLRVLGRITLPDGAAHAQALLDIVPRLPRNPPPAAAAMQAPILVVPRVFEPEFCRHLIGLYESNGGEESGFVRDEDGRTKLVVDHAHKRRQDYIIAEEGVRNAVRARIRRRLLPEIQKAFQYGVTRMERYIVCCYDAGTGGYFRPHRDNTTKGTAHRRFAVTLNLNAEEFEGGELRFPEYGSHLYKPPTGGAVVFSCSLLHEAMPVRKGRRYVFLPFLYDDAAAAIREQNNAYLDESIGAYNR
jgi:peroxiredoxin/predicted 2-oxoglutarate/Fe(II)-dependent dioxygenase YbiX